MSGPELFILDTNLLMLVIVGDTSPKYIEKHKRVSVFDSNNYDDLCALISSGDMITVPHVLAETSNLLAQGVSGDVRDEIFHTFKQYVCQFEEQKIASRRGVESPIFSRLGLTDAILLELATSGTTLITTDGRLFAEVIGRGLQAINFLDFIEGD